MQNLFSGINKFSTYLHAKQSKASLDEKFGFLETCRAASHLHAKAKPSQCLLDDDDVLTPHSHRPY